MRRKANAKASYSHGLRLVECVLYRIWFLNLEHIWVWSYRAIERIFLNLMYFCEILLWRMGSRLPCRCSPIKLIVAQMSSVSTAFILPHSQHLNKSYELFVSLDVGQTCWALYGWCTPLRVLVVPLPITYHPHPDSKVSQFRSTWLDK